MVALWQRRRDMSSSESDEEGDDWIPLSKRPEWADLQPVPQDDGPDPVVPIAYTREFLETMDYFRAILAKDERSERSLSLTEEVIKLNAGNYTVWHFRRLVLEALSHDLWDELKFLEKIAKANFKNYQIWHHRRWTAQSLGTAALPNELHFTEMVLTDDAKNYHAWSHRQWVLQALGGWEGELDFCTKLLQQDIHNNSAWNQRYFVIKNCPFLGGIQSMRDPELKYCADAIHCDPANESPWRYLRGLYKGENEALVKSQVVENVWMQELTKNKDCVFALDLLLDLLCLGYTTPCNVMRLLGVEEDTYTSCQLASVVCMRLKEVDSMRALYWDWRQSSLPINMS